MAETIYTIGHSKHTTEKVVDLLRRHGVTALADVRSQPYSRMNPQFNRETFQESLKDAGISYVFLGRELGARTEERTCYINGKVQYDLLARTAAFQEGLDRIARGVGKFRIALMCAERDPLACHRTILVCRHLVDRHFLVQHILDDGRLESHPDALRRLIFELGFSDNEMFRSHAEVVRDAYLRRGEEIAYMEKESSEAPTGNGGTLAK